MDLTIKEHGHFYGRGGLPLDYLRNPAFLEASFKCSIFQAMCLVHRTVTSTVSLDAKIDARL